MTNTKRSNFKNFEALSETMNGIMAGGFTPIIILDPKSYAGTNKGCTVVNNCNGGNCTTGCGSTGGSGAGGGGYAGM